MHVLLYGSISQLWVRGYDHKLPILLQAVVEKMGNLKIDPERFELVKNMVCSAVT